MNITKYNTFAVIQDGFTNKVMRQYFTKKDLDWSQGSPPKTIETNLYQRRGTDLVIPGGLLKFMEGSYTFDNSVSAVYDKPDEVIKNALEGFEMRDYQVEMVSRMLESNIGSIIAGTGAGKTLVLGAYLKLVGGTSVVIVPTTHLLNETSERLEIYGLNVNIYGHTREIKEGYVNVTMVQSMRNDLKSKGRTMLNEVDHLIVDEAHRSRAATYFDLIMSFPKLKTIHGLSGTFYVNPITSYNWSDFHSFEGSEARLYSLFGVPLYQISYKELRDRGYLSPVRYAMIKTNIKGKKSADYHKVAESTIDSETRQDIGVQVAKDMIQKMGMKKIIIFSRLRETCVGLLTKLNEQGVKAMVVYGGRENLEIKNGELISHGSNGLLSQFGEGDFNVLISTSVMDEGFDLPSIDSAIMFSGGKSDRQLIQRVGRSVRLKEGKEFAMIVDFNDSGNELTKRHSKERAKLATNVFGVEVEYIDKVEELVENNIDNVNKLRL